MKSVPKITRGFGWPHKLSNGHTWFRKATHGSEKPESFTMHGTKFRLARQSFALSDKVFTCTTKFQNGSQEV